MDDCKLTQKQKKYIENIRNIWSIDGYELTKEDEEAMERIAKSKDADIEINKIINREDD